MWTSRVYSLVCVAAHFVDLFTHLHINNAMLSICVAAHFVLVAAKYFDYFTNGHWFD